MLFNPDSTRASKVRTESTCGGDNALQGSRVVGGGTLPAAEGSSVKSSAIEEDDGAKFTSVVGAAKDEPWSSETDPISVK